MASDWAQAHGLADFEDAVTRAMWGGETLAPQYQSFLAQHSDGLGSVVDQWSDYVRRVESGEAQANKNWFEKNPMTTLAAIAATVVTAGAASGYFAAAGAAEAGAGAASAESLAAADAAGGLTAEYGTTAAYSAGISGATDAATYTAAADAAGGLTPEYGNPTAYADAIGNGASTGITASGALSAVNTGLDLIKKVSGASAAVKASRSAATDATRNNSTGASGQRADVHPLSGTWTSPGQVQPLYTPSGAPQSSNFLPWILAAVVGILFVFLIARR